MQARVEREILRNFRRAGETGVARRSRPPSLLYRHQLV